MGDSTVRPNDYVALQLPSDAHKVIQIIPNTFISLGKYGSFQSNQIIGRPYFLTFEIQERTATNSCPNLRIVPASELNAEALSEEKEDCTTGNGSAELATPTVEFADDSKPESEADANVGTTYELVEHEGKIVMHTNRNTIDDPSRQKMTMEDIEMLKHESSISGKDIISKIIASHSAIDQKTAFSLAKYTLRKAKKYLKRFTVLPLDVPTLTDWVLTDKEPMKVIELREELLALVGSWANVHYGGTNGIYPTADGLGRIGGGRYLMVDETGGLLVAAMAERMGILYPEQSPSSDRYVGDDEVDEEQSTSPEQHKRRHPPAMAALTNSITLLHSASQPNLSLLSYFHFDMNKPLPSHPLYSHLKTLSWLQLLHPSHDTAYAHPPPILPASELAELKPGRRTAYFRKIRRYNRIKTVIDETRAGGFDGLITASFMSPVSIVQHTLPLLRGGATITVFSPHVEPLNTLSDYYSTARRSYLQNSTIKPDIPSEDWPVDPTFVLAPTIQTVRLRGWQVLPGRTHPLMTGRGGGEGYVFSARRVVPEKGVRVEARGRFGKAKRRKTEQEGQDSQESRETKDDENEETS